jgi:RHS repeat-associated protein
MAVPERTSTRKRAAAALVLLAALLARGDAGAATQTITTTYTYNGDGAATAVTTQVDSQPATTTYLTWDNFTPDSTTPATGTVSAADGNLLGIGTSPGMTDLTTQFTYDVRDRLTACSPAGQSLVSYAYHANNLLASSTLAAGDTLQFYYDTASTARMINTSQPSTGLVASFLGPVRYLSDGTEQALLQPRKDTAAVYDAAAQTLSPYAYDPYGAPWSGAATTSSGLSSDGTSYDLTQNSFQYAREYQDPSCSAYYLRERWYLPALQTFLSRDPGDPLHRYGYTAGNPIGRTDPSGRKYTAVDFSRGVDKAVHKLSPGIAAYLEPIIPVWGQVMGGIELLGLLPSFWHHPTAEGWVELGFLGASMASEVGGVSRFLDRALATPQGAFRARLVVDAVLGASQTAAQAVPHGRLDVPALVQGIDTTMFGMFYARAVAGVGYRPYNLTADNVAVKAGSALIGDDDDLLIFRTRRSAAVTISGHDVPFKITSPLLEDLHLGVYHEGLIAISKREILYNELLVNEDNAAIDTGVLDEVPKNLQYAYVGRVPAEEWYTNEFKSSPLGVPMQRRENSIVSLDSNDEANGERYRVLSRNCQHHALAVRRALGF